jgi:tetratricopeptide (TPR) repeat protein
VKAIKIEEKAKNIQNVRKMLQNIRDVPFEKSWRIILEGALFEGRSGCKELARKTFSQLLMYCQSYGPIYLEASKFEEREGQLDKAMTICEIGLQYNVKYGPLWFQYLRLYEKCDK